MEYEDKPKREENRLAGDVLEKPATRVTGALVLIALGVVFLLQQNHMLSLTGNWWAIFIAVPAIAMLYNAYAAYNREKRMTTEVRNNLSGGIIVGLVALIAATNQWDRWWPLFLIVPGILLLLGFSKKEKA